MGALSGKRVAVFVEEGFEDLEFWVTVMRLREEDAEVTVVGTKAGMTYRGKNALEAISDVAATGVTADAFDAVVVPGGWAPDQLRVVQDIPAFCRELVAAIAG